MCMYVGVCTCECITEVLDLSKDIIIVDCELSDSTNVTWVF